MRIFRPPEILRHLYPGAIFRMPPAGRRLFLTFDDGPTSGVTEPIIEILLSRNVPAVFFQTGEKIDSATRINDSLSAAGFTIGNHGFKHLNGYKSPIDDYVSNADEGARVTGSDMFRPPYGAITRAQFRLLRARYKIVFWDLMPYDFDPGMPQERILRILKRGVRPGSVIVMHDNNKSRVVNILGEFIDYCREEGYLFGDLKTGN